MKKCDSDIPAIGSKWLYKDHTMLYTVLLVTNTAHLNSKHPVQVVYKGVNEHTWSMPLVDWYSKMKGLAPLGQDND